MKVDKVSVQNPDYSDLIEIHTAITATEDSEFESLCITLPVELCGLYGQCQSGDNSICGEEFTVVKGKSYSVVILMEPKNKRKSMSSFLTIDETLFLSQRKWPLVVTANFVPGEKEKKEPLTQSIELELRPSFSAMVIGAVFGSALLALFSTLHSIIRLITQSSTPATGQSAPQASVGSSFAWLPFVLLGKFVYFAVATFMLLIITKVTEGFEAPINILVKDFWGGVALALFAIPIANTLVEKLQVK